VKYVGLRDVEHCTDNCIRFVIPVELRQALGLTPGTKVQFEVEAGALAVQAQNPGCIFCGSREDLAAHHGRPVCGGCCRDAVVAAR